VGFCRFQPPGTETLRQVGQAKASVILRFPVIGYSVRFSARRAAFYVFSRV
jgi:hypothetical protein